MKCNKASKIVDRGKVMKKERKVRLENLVFLLGLVQNPRVDKVAEFQDWIFVKKNHFFMSDQFVVDYPDGPKEPKILEFLGGVEEVVLKLKDVIKWAEGDESYIEDWRSIIHDGIRLAGSTSFKIDPREENFTLRTEDENLWDNKKEWGKIFISNFLLGENINRLRLCKNCDNLFYVAHGNKQTCSGECGKKKNYKNTQKNIDKEYLTMKVRKSQLKKYKISRRSNGSTEDLKPKERQWLYDQCLKLWTEQGRSQENIERLLPRV